MIGFNERSEKLKLSVPHSSCQLLNYRIYSIKTRLSVAASSTVGPLRPYLTKMTSQLSWLLIGGEHLRKIFGKSSEKSSEKGGF